MMEEMYWSGDVFLAMGSGPIHKINGIMDRFMYKDIVENVMLPHTEEEMPLKLSFQHDNDPKHIEKCIRVALGKQD